MIHVFHRFSEITKLQGMAKSYQEMYKLSQLENLKALVMMVLLVAVLGQLGSWTSFEMVMAIGAAQLSYQLWEVKVQSFKIQLLLGKISFASCHTSFSSTASGGNIIKVLKSLFDKLSFVEFRTFMESWKCRCHQ